MTGQLLFFGFALRCLVAVWNGYFGPSFGAEADAGHYHHVAAGYAVGDTAVTEGRANFFYSFALGKFYAIAGASLFIGSLLSCVVWLVSGWLMIATMRALGVAVARQRLAAFFYSVLPSSVLWTSVTIEEPYQLLFVNLALYAAVHILLRRSSWHWLLLIAAVALGGVLHLSVLAVGVFLSMGAAFGRLRRPDGRMPAHAWILLVVVLAVASVGARTVLTNLYQYRLDGSLAAAIEDYQRRGFATASRSVYREELTIDGTSGLIAFVPVALLQYWFEPLIWNVSQPIDAAFALENLLRGLLIWMALMALIGRVRDRPILATVFLGYVVIETLWSIGTFNWGTAARHHIPAYGLLLVSGLWPVYARPLPVTDGSDLPDHAPARS